jgi:hypothetical protein
MNRKGNGLIILALLVGVAGISIGVFKIIEINEKPPDLWSIALTDYPAAPIEDGWKLIEPGVVPITNPLKGFMPYDSENPDFPHSMEYSYFPVNGIVDKDPAVFNFSIIEKKLDLIANRGHQMVFRLYFDYPNVKSGIPQYLIDAGITTHKYIDYGGGYSPNYDDPRMLDLMIRLITALGEKYDGDPRIGFIQVGLLGFWGEWHTYPHEGWFANTTTQIAVLDRFDRSFNKTHLVVRYADEITTQYNVGFHDDSFGHSTLGEEEWFFYNQIVSANATDRWKSNVIGGEVRPEIQDKIFQRKPLKGQEFDQCVKTTHASWMLNYKIFNPREFGMNEADIQRARIGSQQLGYTFGVCYAKTQTILNSLNTSEVCINISVIIKNYGHAPFYYSWPIEYGLFDSEGALIYNLTTKSDLQGLLPGESINISNLIPNLSSSWLNSFINYSIGVRIPNIMQGGLPVAFANKDQLANGWLYL